MSDGTSYWSRRRFMRGGLILTGGAAFAAACGGGSNNNSGSSKAATSAPVAPSSAANPSGSSATQAAAVASPAATTAAQPKSGGDWRVGLTGVFAGVDPHNSVYNGAIIVPIVYNYLVRTSMLAPDRGVLPELATTWEQTPDKLSALPLFR